MFDIQPPEPLNAGHDTATFDCGKSPLNDFLKQHALDKQNAMLSRTYAATSDSRIAGYYTLAHATILQQDAPRKLGRGMPSSIPAILMARFAVDLQFQGHRLGRSLFIDALRRTWAVMQSGAAPVRLFIVDAKDNEAKAFYERFDMMTASTNPMRLFLSYKTLHNIFEG